MNMDEYVPDNIPTSRGNVNSFIESTPSIYSESIDSKVVTDVLIERVTVWPIDISAICESDILLSDFLFSLILSKTTIVSFIE